MKYVLLVFSLFTYSYTPTFAQPASIIATPPPDTSLAYTVFLIGDVGAPTLPEQEPTLALLQKQLEASDTASTVIYLGDNIYPKGLPDSAERRREEMESYLVEQLKVTNNYPGKVVFIPGNHDWARSGRKGWHRIAAQERYVETYLQKKGNAFLPDNGCPGPVEVPLSEGLTLIVIDTQWFIHPWDKPGEDSDCEAKTAEEVLLQLEDIVKRNAHKQILVTSHHPMYTYGSHGGYYTAKQHLFPLTDLNESLYIPLPVVGSIYPLYRTLLGDPQDTPHPRYRLMRKALTNIFKQHPALIHAAGHEHTLQHIVRDSLNYIVSGAGCKQSHVAHGKYARFVDIGEGFAKLNYYTTGEVWLQFWKPSKENPDGRMIYEQKLQMQPLPEPPDIMGLQSANLSDSTVVVSASNQYEVGPFKKWLLGENYRKVWAQPLEVPLFDIGKEKGGLTIIQRGGGMQTKSLRLENKAGQEFALRSIEKYAGRAVPQALKNTFAVDLVQDQISASHPYAFQVIPTLADAAKIYHTNPKLVYIPDDPRLGTQQAAFANTLALFEERPAGKGEEITIKGLEKAKKLYSTTKMLEKLQEDNDNQVDQLAVLRARLFDLWLGDWDRHDDQWRWAGFSHKHHLLFRPIPRDRDQAFFVNQGFLPKLASRKWIMPKIQGFDKEVRDVNTFMNNARFFDRSFLTEPSLEQWLAMADTLSQDLTDEVITEALRSWPNEIYKLSAEEVARKLTARRERLSGYARQYYLFLAKAVDITGSSKKEYFEVIRQDDLHTQVTVYKIGKEGDHEKELYKRVFKTSETREVRLYGLGGDDVFKVSGRVQDGPLIRIIGGEGRDQIRDVSRVDGVTNKTKVYDTKAGNELTLGQESRNLTSNDPEVNTYDRKEFKYNYIGPLASVEYNLDDGVFLGAGVLYRMHGFRKEPYAMQHSLVFNYAPLTSSYHLRYQGIITDIIGKADLDIDFDRKKPNYVTNFFGLGNETTYALPEEGITYFRVRYRQTLLKTLLRYPIGNFGNIYLGPTYQNFEVERTPGRFVSDFALNGLNATAFEEKYYLGGNVRLLLDKRDSKQLPTEGIHLLIDGSWNKGLKEASANFGQIHSALSLYFTFRLPVQLTVAARVGAGKSFGEYEFFQTQTLSGNTNLRGFRKTRFAGESNMYQNTEVRLKLFSFRSYLFPAQVGLIGFNDVGRVWLDGENSAVWHHGYGGGLYIAPLNQVVMSVMLGFSREDTLPLIKAGFLF